MSSNIISMKDFFLKYRDIAISSNYCFKNKSFLIPKVPLERNIVKISNDKIFFINLSIEKLIIFSILSIN